MTSSVARPVAAQTSQSCSSGALRQRATVTPPSQVTVKSLPSPVSMMTQSPGEEASPSPAPDVVMAAPPMVESPPLLPLPLPPPGLEVDLEPSEEELGPEEPACAEPEMEVDWAHQDDDEEPEALAAEPQHQTAEPQPQALAAAPQAAEVLLPLREVEPPRGGGRISMKRRA